MKVTRIQQQIKRQDRYSIYLDDKYTFSLHEQQLVESGLRVGMDIEKDQVDSLQQESQFGKMYERAVGYTLVRPHSAKEIKDYLERTFLYPKSRRRKNPDGSYELVKREVNKTEVRHSIERVLERLGQKGHIDDTAFAASWVASRNIHKPSSRRRLQQELQMKGVDSEIIANVLQDDNNDRRNLSRLIEKKLRLSRYAGDHKKLQQYLLRQGFSYDDITSVLKDMEDGSLMGDEGS